MASNRDPQKDYRINKRGRKVTSSSTRSKRAKKASASKPTSSTTRSRGSGTGSKQVTSDSSRSSSGKAKVTGGKVTKPKKSLSIGGDTGRRGGTNQPTTAKSKVPTQGRPSIAKVSKQLKTASKSPVAKAGRLVAALRSGPAAVVGTIVSEAFTAAAATASQGKTSRDNRGAAYKAQQKKLPTVNVPDGPKQKKSKPAPKKKASLSAGAKSFDKAFAAARKAGKSTFTWNGKKYNTKIN